MNLTQCVKGYMFAIFKYVQFCAVDFTVPRG